jgi:hypothetical protein
MHSSLSSAEVKNEWSYTSKSPIRLHGMDKDNFAFYLYRMCVHASSKVKRAS